MSQRGDLWRVDYPENTGPLHAPLDWPPRTEEATMADTELIYVDLYGEEVSPDDPAAQTKYNAAELKALRKGGFFPLRPGAAVAEKAADAPSPVMHSGVGAHEGADDEEADAKPPAKAAHGKR